MRRSVLMLGVTLLAVGAIGSAVAYHKLYRWKRFEVVEPGVLLRSGSLKGWQLEEAIRRYGIKTVFSFTFTRNDEEQWICDRAGVKRYFHYLPGDGVGTDDPYLRFLQVAAEPQNHPILVHCSAGVQRTGGAVALYRLFFQRWRFEDAIQEMIDKGNEGKREQIAQLKAIYERLTWPSVADAPKPIPSFPR